MLVVACSLQPRMFHIESTWIAMQGAVMIGRPFTIMADSLRGLALYLALYPVDPLSS